MVGGTVPALVAPAVELGEFTDPDVFAEVDVAGDGSCTDGSEINEPVR